AVLHFVPDNTQADDMVHQLVGGLAPGSFLVISHGAAETFQVLVDSDAGLAYRRQTASTTTPRTRPQVEQFFAGLELLDPGVVWTHGWRPDPADPSECVDKPQLSGAWAGVGRKG